MPATLNKLFYILPKGDILKIFILFILMLISALLEVAGIGMIPAFVAIVATPEKIMQLDWLNPFISFLEINTQQDLLLWGSVVLLGVFLIKSLYIVAFNFLEARFIYNRRYAISRRLMRTYMQAPYTFHLGRNSSELFRNVTTEVNVLTNVIITNLLKMSREGVMTFSILLFLFIVEPQITLLVITLSGVGGGTFILMNKRRMKQYGLEEQQRRIGMIKAVYQGLSGIKDARVLNREDEFIKRFEKEEYKSTRLVAYIRFIQQIPKPVIETTTVLGMLLIAIFLIWQGRSMSAIIPILTLFAMATVRLMPSVQLLISMYTNLRYSLVSLDPIYEDLKALEADNNKLELDRKKKTSIDFQNEIEISNVSYAYPNSEEQAVKNITITIPKGKAVAFVGASGAGKTTIVDLILGLFEPSEGSIFVDGKDIQNNLSAWQQNIGYIPQSIYLADETLRSNIAFGLPADRIDEARIEEAVKLAQLETLIKQLPEGLDTVIGENGTRLSGGQRQRVGIARALYHDPEVLVMDEATSALDNITEREITKAIESLKGERTIIMIAHRLTTVKNCDRLYFMEDGKIIQEGSYSQLVSSNRHFREMALETK